MENKENKFNTLKQINNKKINYGETIATLSVSEFYVFENEIVENVAVDLEKNPEIEAIAIVDKNIKCLGVIDRKKLFDTLGKNFGRDLYKNRPISNLMEKTEKYKYHKNVLTIANKIDYSKTKTEIKYYLIEDDDENFYGIFSNISLMIYLSQQTQIDIQLARKIQDNIVKERYFFKQKNISIAAGCRMAKGVGGDYYEIKKVNEKRIISTICDVSGKGISASLLTAIIGGMIDIEDFSDNKEDDLKIFLKKINNYLTETFMLEKFVTSLFFDIDTENGTVKIYDFGHSMGLSNLYLFRDGNFTNIPIANSTIPFGVQFEIEIKENIIQLQPADIIVAITDGLTDQKNPDGKNYDIKNIIPFLKNNPPIDIALTQIYEDIYNFRDTQPQFDDITVMIIKYQ